MRKGNTGLLRLWGRLLRGLVGIVTLTGRCIPVGVEYGCPTADYRVRGTVKADQTGSPIPGIEVSLQDSGCDSTGCRIDDSTRTETDGGFAFAFSGLPGDHTWRISIRDIDSTVNGSFAAKDTLVRIPRDALRGGDGNWHKGRGTLNLVFRLSATASP